MLSEDLEALLNQRGLKALSSEQGINSFDYLLNSNFVQATVANVDWKIFKSIYELTGLYSLFKQIKVQPSKTISEQTKQQSQIRLQLEQTAIENRHNVLLSYLQAEIARILKIATPQTINPNQGFFDLGMDSLMAVELKNSLEIAFNCSVPATIAFETPTIIDLAAYISKEVLQWNLWEHQTDEQTLSSANHQHSTTSVEIERLTEDEVQESIAEKLEKLESLTRGK
jgi:acyl carrier protein